MTAGTWWQITRLGPGGRPALCVRARTIDAAERDGAALLGDANVIAARVTTTPRRRGRFARRARASP